MLLGAPVRHSVLPMTTPPAQSSPHGLVVVGGGPAARAAALGYRDAGGTGSVVMLSADHAAPYERPPLSKDFLRGDASAASLALDEQDYASKDVTLVLGAEVAVLDTAARTVRTTAGDTYRYTACVLATGGAPVTLPVPGGDDERVLKLRSLAQGEALRDAAAAATSVVVIGSGFIGCEAAASLAGMGKTVTQVSNETLPQVHRLGEDVGRTLAGWLTDAGVTLVGGVTITGVEGGRRVLLSDHEPIEADLVLAAVGSYPLSSLAGAAGLDVHDGRVVVDEHLATSADGVWAAGDVAYARNATAGRHLAVEHWDDAEAMGTIAGTSAAGGEATWDTVPGFWSEIGSQFLQYSAWGDGWDTARFVDNGEGSFTVWYGQDGTTVGVLTCSADEDDEKGRELIRTGAPLPG